MSQVVSQFKGVLIWLANNISSQIKFLFLSFYLSRNINFSRYEVIRYTKKKKNQT